MSPVASLTMAAASELKSRGRLRDRSGMTPIIPRAHHEQQNQTDPLPDRRGPPSEPSEGHCWLGLPEPTPTTIDFHPA